jgi:hypothetical protein
MKKFFMALLLFGIFAISCFSSGEIKIAKRLVFLNFPEKVETSGELGKQTIKNTSKTRIFFHYLNATGRDQVFKLKFDGKFNDFKSGFGYNKEPGFAGSQANSAFFKSIQKQISNPQITQSISHNTTISGIVEATFQSGTKWSCNMGPGEPVDGIKIISTDKFDKKIKIDLTNNKPIYYRLGDNRTDLIPGDYGFNYNFSLENKTSNKKMLICYFNPRGGKMTGVFNVGDKVFFTKEVLPKITTKFYHKIVLPKEKISLEYIPTGGYSYPIELKFKLIDI